MYSLDYVEIANEISVSPEAIRQWQRGRNFPSINYLDPLYNVLQKNVNIKTTPVLSVKLKSEIVKYLNFLNEDMFDETGLDIGGELVSGLKLIYAHVREDVTDMKTGHTQVVFFDFDGTLTNRKETKTTWENIWIALGYEVEECRELHTRYNKKEITHSEWCKLTEEKFIKRNLRREVLNKIANDIELIDGCKETFEELRNRNIKVFIVSGSILYVIQEVLKDLSHYVDEIRANDFVFDINGKLKQIIGTKYDFEGKANYILEKINLLKVSPEDVLFIGNSFNDKYVYRSGAKTLCINPNKTDTSDTMIWNSCIEDCKNLMDVLKYIK